jgi:transcriptional regulator with XRE-family HTH domain
MKENFGSYIKKLRIDNNLTLTQLAAKLDLDSANLSKIENGKRDFDEKRLKLLSAVFNINIDDLQKEYLGDFIARKIYSSDCSDEILQVAEEKVKYLRSINTKQINLDL